MHFTWHTSISEGIFYSFDANSSIKIQSNSSNRKPTADDHYCIHISMLIVHKKRVLVYCNYNPVVLQIHREWFIYWVQFLCSFFKFIHFYVDSAVVIGVIALRGYRAAFINISLKRQCRRVASTWNPLFSCRK